MKKKVVLASLFLLVSLCRAEVRYTVTDLGTLGGTNSYAMGINDNGQVVGGSYLTGNPTYDAGFPSESPITHAFLYDGTTMHDLGTLGGNSSTSYDINNNGQVVGASFITDGSAMHAFLYEGTTMEDLGTLGGSNSWAYGINNYGQVVGSSKTDGGVQHAFLYDGATMEDLGTLAGGTHSVAWDINDSEQIVGRSNIAIAGNFTSHAFLYDETTMNDLGALGGLSSSAYCINNSRQIVGSGIVSANTSHIFLYDGTTMHEIGNSAGIQLHYGINDSGVVVGGSRPNMFDNGYAFIYDETEGMLDLNNLISSNSGWELTSASDINSSGQIVGGGIIDGKHHSYLLTPIPEPCTIFLLGLGGLVLRRKRPSRTISCRNSLV